MKWFSNLPGVVLLLVDERFLELVKRLWPG